MPESLLPPKQKREVSNRKEPRQQKLPGARGEMSRKIHKRSLTPSGKISPSSWVWDWGRSLKEKNKNNSMSNLAPFPNTRAFSRVCEFFPPSYPVPTARLSSLEGHTEFLRWEQERALTVTGFLIWLICFWLRQNRCMESCAIVRHTLPLRNDQSQNLAFAPARYDSFPRAPSGNASEVFKISYV